MSLHSILWTFIVLGGVIVLALIYLVVAMNLFVKRLLREISDRSWYKLEELTEKGYSEGRCRGALSSFYERGMLEVRLRDFQAELDQMTEEIKRLGKEVGIPTERFKGLIFPVMEKPKGFDIPTVHLYEFRLRGGGAPRKFKKTRLTFNQGWQPATA